MTFALVSTRQRRQWDDRGLLSQLTLVCCANRSMLAREQRVSLVVLRAGVDIVLPGTPDQIRIRQSALRRQTARGPHATENDLQPVVSGLPYGIVASLMPE